MVSRSTDINLLTKRFKELGENMEFTCEEEQWMLAYAPEVLHFCLVFKDMKTRDAVR